ncbi:MAG: YqgE/AlgH family protein [Nocardioidaceae bacterium]
MTETTVPARAGDLLVATPALLDPNFERTVVLLLDVDDDGALGVVLNRPSEVTVAEILPDWRDAADDPGVLFSGGPVGPDAALAVGLTSVVGSVADPAGDDPVGFRRLWDGVGMVDLDSPTDLVVPALRHLRIFAGYAGWGRAQLATEIATGSWYVVPSTAEDLSTRDPQQLWTEVLRRQPGELAWVSTRPVDPGLN